MKKIAAFLTSFILFTVGVIGLHFVTGQELTANNPRYGTWINQYKDKSHDAVAGNIEEDTMLLLGSSEFYHGRSSKYHPSRIFREQNMNVMCIGAAYNQSLSHAITLGSIGPKLESRKAVLIVSPSWFKKDGVACNAFDGKFSESQYAAMLDNQSLSQETKKAIAERTEELLAGNDTVKEAVKRYNRIYIGDGGNLYDVAVGSLRRAFVNDRDNYRALAAWNAAGGKKNPEYKKCDKKKNAPGWRMLQKDAQEEFLSQRENPFYMTEKVYEEKFRPYLSNLKNISADKSYAQSPEYGDLELFLKVCREQDVEVMLLILPLNGYWYDYMGFPREGRDACINKVEAIASDYGVETCNLYGESYTKGFFRDAVHPAAKGWVAVNEKIYEFFEQ